MKLILKIITILITTSIIAGGFVLAVNKSLGTSNSSTSNQPPANAQFTGGPEGGDRNEASTSRGLAGIFATFIELTGITAIVLLIENLFSISKNHNLTSPQQ